MDIDGGDLVNGQIQVVDRTGAVEKEYNQAGEVVTELSNGGTGVGTLTQTFGYDARGNQVGSTLSNGMEETRQYDPDGRLVADVYTYAPGTIVHYTSADFPNNSGKLNIGGWLSTATTYYYDPSGEVTGSFDYGRVNADQNYWNSLGRQDDAGTLDVAAQATIPIQPSLANAPNGYGVLGTQSYVSHTGTGDYDNEGNALAYAYVFYDTGLLQWHTNTYTVSYLKQDGYLEKATAGTSDDPNVLATTDTSLYDAFGRRIAIDTNSAGQTTDQVRAFAYDAEGQILERRDGSATSGTFTAAGTYGTQHYAYVNGQQVAEVDEAGAHRLQRRSENPARRHQVPNHKLAFKPICYSLHGMTEVVHALNYQPARRMRSTEPSMPSHGREAAGPPLRN